MNKVTQSILIATAFLAGASAGMGLKIYQEVHSKTELPRLATIQKYYEKSNLKDISFSPINGLYAINANNNLIYTSKTGQYLFLGQVYDMKNKVNISQQEMKDFHMDEKPKSKALINWGGWDKSGEIIYNKGGKYKVAIFADTDCPYCARLHPMLMKLKDVEIHYILMIVHPSSKEKSSQVLASKDKQQALTDALEGKEIQQVSSKDLLRTGLILTENTEQIMQANLTGTPTILNGQGELLEGLPQTQKQLEDFIKKDDKKKGQSHE